MDWVGPGADWRDGEAYAPLLGADRSIFAWEWLRRDPDYRRAALGTADPAAAAAARWGLQRFENPSCAAPGARPVWRADDHPPVLKALARGEAPPGDAIDLFGLGGLATYVADAEGEHWLLSDGLRAVRVDILEGSAAEGPVGLQYLLAGRTSAKAPLLALRRLLSLVEDESFSRTLHPREPKARRWILALRVHDALATGNGQREIAAGLLSDSAAEPRWRVNAASIRSQVQRLVRSARALALGGYRSFLD
jgi:hypothetical protein